MRKTIKIILSMLTVCICAAVLMQLSFAADAGSKAGRVKTTQGNLNIRKSASISSGVLTTAKNKSYITLIKKSGSWWKVEYAKNKYGYCHKDYITSVKASFPAVVNTSSGSLNVRKGTGASCEVKTTLPKGTVVVVISEKDGWSRILYNGRNTGYVSSAYLKKDAYKSVNMSVPYFSQTDSRWANVPIGIQGDTLGSSGCTTTCLAMTESYRTGSTVNPKGMSQKLSYSSSGMLYWPQNYLTELVDGNNYLQKIYSVLKKGKPVIFGMKKSGSSSQHWVVVTSFDGGFTLSSKLFGINDPGSKTRTSLNQVMSSYPVAYKIAYVK